MLWKACKVLLLAVSTNKDMSYNNLLNPQLAPDGLIFYTAKHAQSFTEINMSCCEFNTCVFPFQFFDHLELSYTSNYFWPSSIFDT